MNQGIKEISSTASLLRGVCNTWPCGTPKSNNNAFTGALLEDRPPAVLRAKTGPKRKGALLDRAGNDTVSIEPRRNTLEIFPSDCARTTRIMRASI